MRGLASASMRRVVAGPVVGSRIALLHRPLPAHRLDPSLEGEPLGGVQGDATEDGREALDTVSPLASITWLMTIFCIASWFTGTPAMRLASSAVHRGLSIERPNQVWASDICYISMAKGFM